MKKYHLTKYLLIGSIVILIGTLAIQLGQRQVCGYYENESCISPIPLPSPTPIISPSCTPTPEISISPSESSPMPSQIVPTDTPETQIGSPASANNSAGSSANTNNSPYVTIVQSGPQPTLMPGAGWK